MTDDIIAKLRKTLRATGYPIELKIASVARRKGWHVFHSVQYEDPETLKFRELDLLIYKMLRGRRVELRISCKSSVNKQFVFFTRDSKYYLDVGQLKITPVSDHPDRKQIPKWFDGLRFFSHETEAVNYTVAVGDKLDRDAKALLRDAILSVVNSIHYRIIPYELVFDARGTIHFFVVVLGGRMFEARHDDSADELLIKEIDYARWSGRIEIPSSYLGLELQAHDGSKIKFSEAMYHFSNWVRVELVNQSLFPQFLDDLEAVIKALPKEAIATVGAPWTKKNFPKGLMPSTPLFQSQRKTKRQKG